MSSSPKWVFPYGNGEDVRGESGGDKESVSASPKKTFVREMIQNTVDARVDGEPFVTIEFVSFTTAPDDSLDFAGFRDEVHQIYGSIKSANASSRITYIEKMQKSLSTMLINWIRVSDHGTSGLFGVSRPKDLKENAWLAFTKGTGYTTKFGSQGGSKGIGKRSAFNMSEISTIFVSTRTKQNEVGYQGLAKLISRQKEEDYTSGNGYFGNEKLPVNKYRSFDPEYVRESNDLGTDIFIPFSKDSSEEFHDTIEETAIDSFMPTIMKLMSGGLEVRIEKRNVINESTLPNYIQRILANPNKCVARFISEEYRCLTSKNSKHFIKTIPDMGKLDLYIVTGSSGVSLEKIVVYRDPGIKVSTINSTCDVDYTGVLLITGDNLVKLLRSAENATHTKWDTTLVDDTSSEYSRKDVENAVELVTKFADECVDSISNTPKGARVSFAGVSGFFRDIDASEDEDAREKVGMPSSEARVSSKPLPKKRMRSKKNTIENDSGKVDQFIEATGEPNESGDETISPPEGHNTGTGGDPHEGEDQTGSPSDNITMKLVSLETSKKVLSYQGNGQYELMFELPISATNLYIKIQKVGAEGDNEVSRIEKASGALGTICYLESNFIRMRRAKRDRPYRISIKMDEKHNYAWEVEINGYQK